MIYPAKPKMSLTKYRLSGLKIEELVRKRINGRINNVQEADNGSFNAVYLITLENSQEVVLKVAPSPDSDLLTCEFEIMRTEILFSRIAAQVRIPTPNIVYTDLTRSIVPTDYIFMERLSGMRLDAVKPELTEAGEAEIRRGLGRYAARLHAVSGHFFGYPRSDGRTQSNSWRKSFMAMIDDILKDAQRLGANLGASAENVSRIVRSQAAILSDVRQAVLVHFDLWDGNIFVNSDYSIEGIIDGERAFYGDPCAEFVSLALFRDFADVPDLLEEYRRESGNAAISHPSARKRIYMYTLYLYLLMLVEGPTRGYSGASYEQFLDSVRVRVDELLTALDNGA